MKQLRISSSLNLHAPVRNDLSGHIREGLLFHKKMGFDAADLDMSGMEFSDGQWRSCIEQAVLDAEEAKIKIELCHLPFVGGGAMKDPEALRKFNERMYKAIDAAKILGADHAVMHPNAASMPLKKFDRAAQYDSVMSHLGPFAEYAAKVGVSVVVENMRVVNGAMLSHRYCQTPEELCEIADALGVGVCWDFGHANISGLRQSQALAYVGKRLKVLHVNDNFAVDDEHLAPFMGNVDWKDAMHGLALVDFQGLLNFEVSTGRMPAAARKSYASYLVDTAKELMTYIE